MKFDRLPNIWITLDKIQHTLGWSTEDLCDRLKMTNQQFHREKKLNQSPQLSSITHLTESIGISIDAIIRGKIDFHILRAHHHGDFEQLPERYSVATFSKRKTTIHLLDFIESNFGWQTKKSILNQFQINESIMMKPESEVNFRLPTDICEYLGIHYRMPLKVIEKMGAHSAITNKNTQAGKTLFQLRTPKNLLEIFFADLVNRHFERNHAYEILSLNERFCLVETKLNEELKELLKTKELGNLFACHSIAGTMSSLTAYLGLPTSNVTKISCIHKGDCSCRYLIDFSIPQAQAILFKNQQKTLH